MSTPRTQSLTRALDLMRALKRFPQGATTAALAGATGLHPATAGRLLLTLQDAEFVTRGSEGWVVGPELNRIVVRSAPHRSLVARARPVLERAAAAGRESAMLVVPRPGPQIDILVQADGPWLLGLTNWVGRRIDLYASAAGKLVLAELSDEELAAWIKRTRPRRLTPHTLTTHKQIAKELDLVRSQGWATLREESEVGLGSIALEVRDPDGALSAILAFSGPDQRLDYPRLLAQLRQARSELSGVAPDD